MNKKIMTAGGAEAVKQNGRHSTDLMMWDKKIEYLRESRKDLWNPDYFEHLVKNVWRINKHVKIADFGCGMGYLGSVLLPLLPEGSSYTGYDVNAKLLGQARNIFAGSIWKTEFIEQNLTEFTPVEKYDVAICQAVLVHIPSPVSVLKKMAASVIPGGLVICIEPSWAFSNLGVYRHGMEVYSYEDWGTYQKLFDIELKRGGCDRMVGIKLPAMMSDLGLVDIDIRINDKASLRFYEPNKEKLLKDRAERREERFNNPAYYKNAGLDDSEAERHVENHLRTEDYEDSHEGRLSKVEAMAWLASFGKKQG